MDEYIEKEAMRTIIREQESKHGLRGMAWVEMAMDRHPAADIALLPHGLRKAKKKLLKRGTGGLTSDQVHLWSQNSRRS